MDKDLLKKKLHEQIDALDDELAPEQLERLKKSLQQAANGQTVSHEEAKKRIKEWLN